MISENLNYMRPIVKLVAKVINYSSKLQPIGCENYKKHDEEIFASQNCHEILKHVIFKVSMTDVA